MRRLLLLVLLMLALNARAVPRWGIELHDRLAQPAVPAVALTLDACAGEFDAGLVATLVRLRVPATVFVTKKWLDRNPAGVAVLLAHPDLFELEDHGAAHVPAFVGNGRRLYGLAGESDRAHLEAEVTGGAQAIQALSGRAPRFYRGATAVYDPQGLQTVQRLGFEVAGFSVNADQGATLPRRAIVERLRRVTAGDVIIAHMNRPRGDTAAALAIALPELLARGLQFVTLAQARLSVVR